MKQWGRRLIRFTTSVFQSLLSLVLVSIYSRSGGRKKLAGLSRGREIFVLANGPSLQKDIRELNNRSRPEVDVIVVNDFCISDLFGKVQPEFYVINDPAYWTPNQHTIQEGVERFFSVMNARVQWQLILLVPFSGYKAVLSRLNNDHIRVIPFNNTPVVGFKPLELYLYRRALGAPQLQNVLAAAIYLSVVMQFKEIHLLGVDHDWHRKIGVDAQNHVVWANNHFYDRDGATDQQQRIYNGEDFFDLQQIFEALATTHRSYKKLQVFAAGEDAEILNYTNTSCIDAFKRMNQ
jgi:hypothetical protein